MSGNDQKRGAGDSRQPLCSYVIPESRLQTTVSAWQDTRAQLEAMDEASLGETEPAIMFGWRLNQP